MHKPSLAEARLGRRRSVPALVTAASALVGVMGVLLNIGTFAADLKLLPPEEAFRFAARALDTRTIEANFSIANGYYLYRDKMSFVIEPDATALGASALPPGKVKDDPFFGQVETYRDRVVVRLPLSQASPGRKVTLRAESQGCADAGVCYPPNTQRVTLAVPSNDGRPGALVEATPPRKRWLP